jgi:hypothetical protein
LATNEFLLKAELKHSEAGKRLRDEFFENQEGKSTEEAPNDDW